MLRRHGMMPGMPSRPAARDASLGDGSDARRFRPGPTRVANRPRGGALLSTAPGWRPSHGDISPWDSPPRTLTPVFGERRSAEQRFGNERFRDGLAGVRSAARAELAPSLHPPGPVAPRRRPAR